ncbi:hypothetical protein GWK47_015085 [Chionoecetes opilio]|uniref:Uncharacterized protein n=1 Tax=Chionoecetes opilio TaxID=41210 RepID=A0A8J5CKR5_CHIOP|nr:hypothetical protein GWK47_015085 [Chionoecetes opilio]
MKPRELQQTCGWCIAQSFSKKLLHLKITQVYDRLSLVELLVSFARHYHVILTHWGIEDQLYRSLIACIRNRQNHAVFLTAMLVYCSKVTIDQIGMAVNECSQTHEVESGLCLSQDECWGMLQVLTEYQKQQSQYMNQGKEEGTKSFMLPTKCLVLEGIYFHDSNFVSHLLEKMPNLQRLSLEVGNMTHLRLTLSGQHSFDKLHLILDSCPNLHTLSIHPTLYHEEARRHYEREEFVVDQIVEENLDLFERLMFADVMREVVNVQPMMQNPEEGSRFWRMSKKEPAKPHNLTTLRIASLCEAGQKQSEIFLRGVFERLPNLRNLCLGMWMGSLSQMRQFLTCTATALVSVVTDKELKEPLLPHLRQLCCLPTGDKTQMCQSLASLVEALPSLHTLVLPALDDGALAPTLRHFQHSSIDIQYKCATDHVFSYWEPVH